jgi:hypothetical protein
MAISLMFYFAYDMLRNMQYRRKMAANPLIIAHMGNKSSFAIGENVYCFLRHNFIHNGHGASHAPMHWLTEIVGP